jgi:hypothetical protein
MPPRKGIKRKKRDKEEDEETENWSQNVLLSHLCHSVDLVTIDITFLNIVIDKKRAALLLENTPSKWKRDPNEPDNFLYHSGDTSHEGLSDALIQYWLQFTVMERIWESNGMNLVTWTNGIPDHTEDKNTPARVVYRMKNRTTNEKEIWIQNWAKADLVTCRVTTEDSTVSEEYRQYGVLHRTNGPAWLSYHKKEVKFAHKNIEEYYNRGKLHNERGPAVIKETVHTNGTVMYEYHWYLNGVKYAYKKHNGPYTNLFPSIWKKDSLRSHTRTCLTEQ